MDHTFTCNFGRGVSVKTHIPPVPPNNPSLFNPMVEWTGKPKRKKHFRPYIAWMNQVMQQTADSWGQMILRGYHNEKGVIEFWSYEPGKSPQLLENFYQ